MAPADARVKLLVDLYWPSRAGEGSPCWIMLNSNLCRAQANECLLLGSRKAFAGIATSGSAQ
jgi:hypothetical protein